MGESSRQYPFGMVEDILRESGAEPTEPDRQTEMDGGILLTSGIHVYLPRYGINVHEGFFCHMEKGRLVPQNMLTVIYDRTDKEYLYDAEKTSWTRCMNGWMGKTAACRGKEAESDCKPWKIRQYREKGKQV